MAHDHAHGIGRDADRRLLAGALVLIVAFLAGEVVVGLVVGSLALLADAGHMLTDAGAIGLALVAMRLAARPATGAYTFGLRRVEILSAQVNGLTLAVLVVVFVIGGVRRLLDPPDVPGAPLAVVAAVGILVNLAAAALLARADRRSLNVAGAYWHVVTDLFAFVATLVAGLVIRWTGWTRADAAAALVVAALMAAAAYRLLRDSSRVFLEAAPRGLDAGVVEAAIRAVDDVADVHELHVWEVTSGFPALSAHVLVDASADCHERRLTIESLLGSTFGIEHTTLQVDHRDDVLPPSTLGRRIHPERRRHH
ncbi:MAG TPA: cation diffusion facilitator family transporter [Nocardioides sp.]|uniref:cation diffusion facilitator family transporter n=1 Tax=Nocardioides sp. TaxID=35761 RepID=UPI002F422163